MVIFVIGCVILIAAVVVTLIRCRQEDDLKVSIGIPIGLFVVSVILIGAECIYTQDVGEAVVLRNFSAVLVYFFLFINPNSFANFFSFSVIS